MKIFCYSLALLSIAACGGGGSGAPQSQAIGSTNKPLVDYRPYYFPIVAGTYSTLCGPEKLPKVFSVSADGIFSPWFNGILDLKASDLVLSYTRGNQNEVPASDVLDVGFGMLAGKTAVVGGINSRTDGVIAGTEVINGVLNSFSCQPSAAAVALKSKTAYQAFSRFIDAPKTSLTCFEIGNPTATSVQSYSVSAGKLTVQDEVIPLLEGVKVEFVGDGGRVVKNGVETQMLSYSVDRLDGRKMAMVFDEYGELATLQYTPASGKSFGCGIAK